MNRAWVAGIVLVVAAVAFFAGRSLAPPAAVQAPAAGSAADAPGAANARVGELAATVATLTEEKRKESDARAAAEAEVARLKGELREARGETAPAGEGKPKGPRFVVAGMEEALRDFDFRAAGEATRHIAPLLVELATAIREGKSYPPSVGDIQRWNGSLVKEALALESKNVPGYGINGKFTHPAIQANLVYAALADAGLPLTDEQAAALEELAKRYVEEDKRRRDSYTEDAIELRNVLDEADLKDRFYTEVDRLLDEAQREALHPAAMRGRLQTDMFSSGILLATVSRPAFYADRAELESEFLKVAKEHVPFTENELPMLAELAARWVASLSDEYIAEPSDGLARHMMVPVERVRIAGRAQLAATEETIGRLPAGSEAAKNLRESAVILVPIRK